ncbi:MAG: YesL family protein [Lachnospiraceae bacterium]|nr:YesL family protein [Lachnospiraceae bacterium]
MRGLFNLEGPLFTALNKLSDLIILNLLFVLCSLPIVTIGASMTALSYVTLKMKEGEEGYVARSFFRSFKQNFKQATIIWIFMLLIAVLMFMDFRIMRLYEGTVGTVMRISVYLGALIWGMILVYIFPLLARFENSIRQTVQNAILLAIANAPKTLLMLAVIFVAVFLTLWNATTIIWGILIWFLIGFSALSYIDSMLLVPVFHRLAPPEEEEEEALEEAQDEEES